MVLRGCPSSDDERLSPKALAEMPNCFSSGSSADDKNHFLEPWTYTKSADEAWKDILSVAEGYPPGQDGIDGGGWKIVKKEPVGYLYQVFESEKIGYYDDLELSLMEGGQCLVRSASRAGYLDFGVNAKRLNYFAKVGTAHELGVMSAFHNPPDHSGSRSMGGPLTSHVSTPQALNSKGGWDCSLVTAERYPLYFKQNGA